MNIKNKRKNFRLKLPGKAAMWVLRLGLPVISAALIALTLKFQTDAETTPVTALITYPEMYSHILAALTLLILGAMVFDIIERF